jgi:hypothetical protein
VGPPIRDRTRSVQKLALLLLLPAALIGSLFSMAQHSGSATVSKAPTSTTSASTARLTSAYTPHSYTGNGVIPFGNASYYGSPANITLASPVVAMASTPNGGGYWMVAADGGVFNYGNAGFFGSAGNLHLYAPIVAMAATPTGNGYWLVAADGGVFAFGDAVFYGSMGDHHLNHPIVGMATTTNGAGYWLVASDGGIFSFGNASFEGSMGGQHLNEPVVGMAATTDGGGYWLCAADGGIFSFGDARFMGSLGSNPPYDSITGITAQPGGDGYWMVDWAGQVFGFGQQQTLGSIDNQVPAIPVSGIVSTPTGSGYWLLAPQDFKYTFADSGVAPTAPEAGAIVAAASSQIGGDPDLSEGPFCNPYGPCEQWCALFATWTWEHAGVDIPGYGFVGDVYDWGANLGLDVYPPVVPRPGDAILYGTSPNNGFTSPHMGIVAEAWPDGEVITIEGDAGPGQTGQLNVVINGPFMVADSKSYNGFGVYAFVQPPG